MSEIRNVLLISVDCLRADRFREGIEAGRLPAFAALDERGTTFGSAFTVANTTDPSLTSFVTGRYPLDHGVVENGWGLDADVPVAAERFRERGAETFGVVSVDHLNHEHSGLGRGFDRYFEGGSYDTLYPILSRIYDTKAFNAVFGAVKDLGTERYTVKSLLRDTGLIDLHCRPAKKVTADAIDGLDGASPPFFGWVHYFDVHEPRNAPRDLLGEHGEYDAATIHVDRQVETLMDELRERGLEEETLVVLTGDHGEALGDHGYTGHGRTLYDEELHVPLVFAHESLPDETVGAQVRTVDILPTVLSLVDAPELDAAGEPLFDDVDAEIPAPVDADRPVYAMAYPTFEDRVAVRSGGWKLVLDQETGDEQLYDLAADPEERDDLLADASDEGSNKDRTERDGDPDLDGEAASRYDALAADLDEWLATVGDAERQSVDAETEQMLADLGYAE